MTTRLLARLHDPELRDTLEAALAAVPPLSGPRTVAAVAIAAIEAHLAAPADAPVRGFLATHLGIVYLLAEHQGATHARLRRYWDAKSARSGTDAWAWISDSGLRTRCSELVRWGIVEDSGARGESPTGRRSTIWTLVGAHPADLGRDVETVPAVEPGIAAALDVLLEQAGPDVIVRAQLLLAAQIAGVDLSPAAARDTSPTALAVTR